MTKAPSVSRSYGPPGCDGGLKSVFGIILLLRGVTRIVIVWQSRLTLVELGPDFRRFRLVTPD